MRHDFSHPVAVALMLGHIPCLFSRVVGAGEQIDFRSDYEFQSTTLIQPQFTPAHWVSFAVFYPFRWVYGDAFMETFLRAGIDETSTFPGDDLETGHVYDSLSGKFGETGTIAKWKRHVHAEAHKFYCRLPKDTSLLTLANYKTHFWEHASLGKKYRQFGLPLAYPEHYALDGLWAEMTDEGLLVDVQNSKVSLLDQKKQQNDRIREYERLTGEEFYEDLMAERFGTDVTVEVDKRPLLIQEPNIVPLMNLRHEPTDQAGVARMTGRWKANISDRWVHRANEEGVVMYFGGFRLDWLNPSLRNSIMDAVDYTYNEIANDPRFLQQDEPRNYTMADYYAGGSNTTNISVQPEHQARRFHPPLIDPIFESRGRYALSDRKLKLADREYFCKPDEFHNIFGGTVLRNAHIIGANIVTSDSRMPDVALNPGVSL